MHLPLLQSLESSALAMCMKAEQYQANKNTPASVSQHRPQQGALASASVHRGTVGKGALSGSTGRTSFSFSTHASCTMKGRYQAQQDAPDSASVHKRAVSRKGAIKLSPASAASWAGSRAAARASPSTTPCLSSRLKVLPGQHDSQLGSCQATTVSLC